MSLVIFSGVPYNGGKQLQGGLRKHPGDGFRKGEGTYGSRKAAEGMD